MWKISDGAVGVRLHLLNIHMTAHTQRAKQYETRHNILFLIETGYTLVLLLAFLLTGASAALADWARGFAANPWLHVALYGAVVIIATKLLFLPLNFYADYRLEHQFKLSNQTLAGWAWDEVKSLVLNLALGVVLSALFPVLILPLFYKLEQLDNDSLRQRLIALAEKVGAKVLGVYRLALSEKTKKANAAFAGLGRTKRIILGDTLLAQFPEDEIEVVLAHELAHYRHGDLYRMLAGNMVTIFTGLWVADRILRWGLQRLGWVNVAELAAFPLLALCLFGFGLLVLPLNNAFSRRRERLADRVALELTGNKAAFIRAMQRLGTQNLADTSPHPVVEWLLHDHPSLARRIRWAEEWRPS